MITLNHPVTGHQVRTDDTSADFWKAAGYRESKKAPAKKAASRKRTTK